MHMEAPRGLQDPETLAERQRMLEETASVQPLREWAEGMIARRSPRQSDLLVPHFDPADAGTNAKTLLLFDAPGTMIDGSTERPGSGFASVDNDDALAENVWNLRQEIGFENVVQWNIVPWYLAAARKKPNAAELAQGAMELRGLLPVLKKLRVVVLCGPHAQDGWWKHVEPFLGNTYSAFNSLLPSPLVMKQAGKRDDIVRVFTRAKQVAG